MRITALKTLVAGLSACVCLSGAALSVSSQASAADPSLTSGTSQSYQRYLYDSRYNGTQPMTQQQWLAQNYPVRPQTWPGVYQTNTGIVPAHYGTSNYGMPGNGYGLSPISRTSGSGYAYGSGSNQWGRLQNPGSGYESQYRNPASMGWDPANRTSQNDRWLHTNVPGTSGVNSGGQGCAGGRCSDCSNGQCDDLNGPTSLDRSNHNHFGQNPSMANGNRDMLRRDMLAPQHRIAGQYGY